LFPVGEVCFSHPATNHRKLVRKMVCKMGIGPAPLVGLTRQPAGNHPQTPGLPTKKEGPILSERPQGKVEEG
jgi:hypothetical protein